MGTIVVKNLPEELHVRLRERAERNHRSMTGEVINLLSTALGSEPNATVLERPLPPVAQRSAKAVRPGSFEVGVAKPVVEPRVQPDGRDALRAALIKQADGSFVNVLGIDDASFFDTLERVRAEAREAETEDLFGDAA